MKPMTVYDVAGLTRSRLLSERVDTGREVTAAYCCDLLSWVMSRAQPDMALITVQTHMNVIGVAALMDMACVIVPERIAVSDDVVEKAASEGIAVMSSDMSGFELCGVLYGAGLAAPRRG